MVDLRVDTLALRAAAGHLREVVAATHAGRTRSGAVRELAACVGAGRAPAAVEEFLDHWSYGLGLVQDDARALAYTLGQAATAFEAVEAQLAAAATCDPNPPTALNSPAPEDPPLPTATPVPRYRPTPTIRSHLPDGSPWWVELSVATHPRDLVPGDPLLVDDVATELRRFAIGAGQAADRIRCLALGGWVGAAAEGFTREAADLPVRLDEAATAFGGAACALLTHADNLRAAQGLARRAMDEWAQAEASARSRTEPLTSPISWGAVLPTTLGVRTATTTGPGAAARDNAERLLGAARDQAGESGDALAAALRQAADTAPHKPGGWSRLWGAVSSFAKGAGEATWSMVTFAAELDPRHALINPKGYLANLEGLGKGVLFAIENPDEFGKAILDWKTWQDDPARALGHLLPELLLTVATAGAGSAAKGTSAAARLSRFTGPTDADRVFTMRIARTGEEIKALNFSPPRIPVADARAAAERQGLDTRSIELRLRREDEPGWNPYAYASTPFHFDPRTLEVTRPMRAANGRFIVELQPAALEDEVSAAMTISHELYHLRAWEKGLDVHDELGPETAAELTQMYWRQK